MSFIQDLTEHILMISSYNDFIPDAVQKLKKFSVFLASVKAVAAHDQKTAVVVWDKTRSRQCLFRR